MTSYLTKYRVPLLAAIAALGLATALPAFAQQTYQPSSQTVANPGRRVAARSSVQPAAVEEAVDGAGVVMGRRGPVPVPPTTPAWQRRSPNFPPQPKMVSHADAPLEPQAEEIGVGKMHKNGDTYIDGSDGIMGGGDCCNSCGGGGCGGCGGCNNCCDEEDCCIPCPWVTNLTFFGGVQGFTGPPNLGAQGSFGFNEGFNTAIPLRIGCCHTGLGLQFGVRGVQSNFSGSFPTITTEQRNQLFVTAGIFRRVDWGLQGGIVADYLEDSFWYDIKIAQLRAEASWLFPCSNHEIGVFATVSTDNTEDTSTQTANPMVPLSSLWRANDQIAFFYRYRFSDCCESSGYARVFGGFSGERDGLFGGDLLAPLNDSWAIQAGFTYLIPAEAAEDGGVFNEAWNVGFNFVYYPRCNARCGGYYRPLFNVADNGSFLISRATPEDDDD